MSGDDLFRWVPTLGAVFSVLGAGFNAIRLKRRIGKSPIVVFRSGNTGEKLRVSLFIAVLGFLVFSGFNPRVWDIWVVSPPSALHRLPALVILLSGFGCFVVGAQALGDSWRIGVDPELTPKLVTNGVYSRVRHPIYTGVLCAFWGLALYTMSLFYFGVAVVGYVLIRAQARREERFLTGLFGPEYGAYLSRTGRFIPRLGARSAKN